MQINRIMYVDAGQYCENICLQECDEKLQSGDRYKTTQGYNSQYAKRKYEPTYNFQQCVSRHHVSKKPDTEAERAGEIRNHFNSNH